MTVLSTALTATLKRQRTAAPIAAIHADPGPVQAYAEWIAGLKGSSHEVVAIPTGSAAHGMGYRFVSIPSVERDYYLANGATLPTQSKKDMPG